MQVPDICANCERLRIGHPDFPGLPSTVQDLMCDDFDCPHDKRTESDPAIN